MEMNAPIWFIFALLVCWSTGNHASNIGGRGVNAARTGTGRHRKIQKGAKNETRVQKDAMAGILYENRRVNKEIVKGRADQMLVEGDILVPHSDGSSRQRRTVAKIEGVKWPGGVVPYIVDPTFKDREKRTIFSAMQRFHDETCIKFRKRTIEPDYLFITPGRGCWSMVGRQGNMQKLSLFGTCKVRKGTIMHELMHCLGFRHEHNRPDRDSYIRIMWQNIEAGYSENFIRHSSSEVDTMNTRYDYFSIMHYPLTAFSSNRQWTIQPLQLHHSFSLVGSRHDFSEQDIRRVNQLYNCGACTDTDNLYCPVWAMRGECERNLAWMAEHCPHSCDTCPERRGVTRIHVKDCDDSNDQCEKWANRGECRRNPSYMERHCRRSCHLCYVDVTWNQETSLEEEEEEVCADDEVNCAGWAREGLCTTHAAYMLKSCKKSCMVCTPATRNSKQMRAGGKRIGAITNEILDETIHTDEDDDNDGTVGKCRDKKKQCSDWAEDGQCELYKHWMTVNCPKSCDFCDVSIDKSCVDKEKKCNLWVTKKECRKNKGWFLPNCQFSCNACSETVPSCVDQHRSCRKKAKKGLCGQKAKIRKECPYSCNSCSDE